MNPWPLVVFSVILFTAFQISYYSNNSLFSIPKSMYVVSLKLLTLQLLERSLVFEMEKKTTCLLEDIFTQIYKMACFKNLTIEESKMLTKPTSKPKKHNTTTVTRPIKTHTYVYLKTLKTCTLINLDQRWWIWKVK